MTKTFPAYAGVTRVLNMYIRIGMSSTDLWKSLFYNATVMFWKSTMTSLLYSQCCVLRRILPCLYLYKYIYSHDVVIIIGIVVELAITNKVLANQ
jgi:hypothetical protein